MSTRAEKTLKEKLARYMDPEPFRQGISMSVTHTCPSMARREAAVLKARRQAALRNAESAIRFFLKPDVLEALNRRSAAETKASNHPSLKEEP